MTMPPEIPEPIVDPAAIARWPTYAAAHLLGLALLGVVLAALPVAPTDLDRHQFPKELLGHLFVWLSVALARPIRPAGVRVGAIWLLAAFAALTIGASTGATNPWLALRATTLTCTAIAAFMTARHVSAHGASGILLAWIACSVTTAACTGLAQAYGASTALFATTRSPGGTFGNRNFLAHFVTLASPLLVTLSITARRTPSAILASAALVPCTMIVVLSRSRAAWVGAIAIGMVLSATIMLSRHRRSAISPVRAVALAIAITAAIVAAFALPNALRWRTDSPYSETLAGIANHREGSGRGRMLQYRHTLRLAAAHPVLGVGPGNWPLRYGDFAPSDDPSWSRGDVIPLNPWPSSDWMALASERGFGAVAVAVLFGLALSWRGWLGVRAGGDRAIAGGAVVAMVVAIAIEGSFDAVMLLMAPALLAAIASGALLERADMSVASEMRPVASPRALWWPAVLLLLLVGTLRSAQQTAAYVVAGDARNLGRLVWAARIDPWSYPIRVALARREGCRDARDDAAAVVQLAPTWTSARLAARRCGASR